MRIPRAQQRKTDNQENTGAILKDAREKANEIGKRDVALLKAFHDSIVESMKQSNKKETTSTEFVVFDVFDSMDSIDSVDDDIFDN